MAQGKAHPDDVRTTAEVLLRQGLRISAVQKSLERLTGDVPESSTLRRWRLGLRDRYTQPPTWTGQVAYRIAQLDVLEEWAGTLRDAAIMRQGVRELRPQTVARVVRIKKTMQRHWPKVARATAHFWEELEELIRQAYSGGEPLPVYPPKGVLTKLTEEAGAKKKPESATTELRIVGIHAKKH